MCSLRRKYGSKSSNRQPVAPATSYRCPDLNDLGRDSFDDAHEALLQRARLIRGRDRHTGDPVAGRCGAAAAGCKGR
jgi:hypothetical protein